MNDQPSELVALSLDFSDCDATNARYKRQQSELLPGNKGATFDALAAVGITIVTISFDGYGDSGQIESVEAKAGEDVVPLAAGTITITSPLWCQLEPETKQMSVYDAIEKLAYEFLEDTHGGWEDGEGAYGDFTFDVSARTITLDYNERYIETHYHQHEF